MLNFSHKTEYRTVAIKIALLFSDCARDTMIYFPEKGMMVTETCTALGNYQANQNVGQTFYCVDSDGYPVTPMLTAWPADNCASFANV